MCVLLVWRFSAGELCLFDVLSNRACTVNPSSHHLPSVFCLFPLLFTLSPSPPLTRRPVLLYFIFYGDYVMFVVVS